MLSSNDAKAGSAFWTVLITSAGAALAFAGAALMAYCLSLPGGVEAGPFSSLADARGFTVLLAYGFAAYGLIFAACAVAAYAELRRLAHL